MSDTRPNLRRELRKRRRALSADQRRARQRLLVDHLVHHRHFRNSRRIALYWPADGEPDIRALVAHPLARRKRFFLPVLVPFSSTPMWFAPWRPGDRLVPNRFGIPEPDPGARHLVAGRLLDLVLMPLVGFDEAGNRLGMGGGFFDRSFAFLRHRRRWFKPRLMGTAFDCQGVEGLPHRPWDVPMDALATESGSRMFRRQSARGARKSA